MKSKRFLIYLYLFFLLLILENVNCKETFKNECQKNSNDINNDIIYPSFSPLNQNNLNNEIEAKYCFEEVKKTIIPGEVQTFLLFREKVYNFDFNINNYNKEDELLIHFYPLDCQIDIIKDKSENEIKVERVSNYENDAFYTIIKKDKLNTTNIKIVALIKSINDIYQNRTFHLIINSFEYINNTNLIIKEKDQSFLTFNRKIEKINLLFNLNKSANYIYPLSISFFIKERVKFEITVSNGENKSLKKKIAYADRIIIDTNFFPKKSSCISISIQKIEKEKNANMIVKVIGDYSTPIYFEKNILNMGFIPGNVSYQYYYMEVFKGEHGEIILNNKRYNGMLIYKIISKKGANENDIFYKSEYYPKYENENNILNYNEYSQNIVFSSNETNICTEGCFLLITYYSIYFNKMINTKIIGTEFTLLCRIFDDEEEFRSQIINIPLNEYIFGSFEFLSFNIHYYSIYIPENEEKILLDINSNNIAIYIKKGIKQMNVFNFYPLEINYFGEFLYYLEAKDYGLESLGGQYITIGLVNYLVLENTNYYFRILNEYSSNNYRIYPLDTNKASICNTTLINDIYSCFFIINNIYKDLYNDLIIYSYGEEKVNYTAWFSENDESDFYSINLASLNYSKLINEDNNIYFKIDKESHVNSKYILIKVQSNNFRTLSIISYFYDNTFFFPTVQIYSYQLFYLEFQGSIKFNVTKNPSRKYRIVIDNIYGQGEINSSSIALNKFSLISGKRILSFPITNDMKNIEIKNPFGSELLIKIKVVSEINSQMLEELQFNYDYEGKEKTLPISYYLKEIEYEGADINFYFNFNNSNINKEDLIIRGYKLNYDLMRLINDKSFTKFDPGEEIEGKFDSRTNSGLIVFDKEEENSNYDNDYYYLIEIESKVIENITMDIYAISKNSEFSIPVNKYISGFFNLINNQFQSQEYYIDITNDKNNSYIVEFSTNSEYIELNFGGAITENKVTIDEGIEKYFITINFTENYGNYFKVQTKKNYNKKNNNNLNTANYILRYYYDEPKVNFTMELRGELRNINNSKHLEIKNVKYNPDFKDSNYIFTYIFNIYEKNEIIKGESINTITPVDSKSIYSNTITNSNDVLNEMSFDVDELILDKKYIGTVFTIIGEKRKNVKSYYLYSFNISKDDNDKDKVKIKSSLLIILAIVVVSIIIIVIFAINYKKIKNKNKELETQVNTISFAEEKENKDDEFRVTLV